MKFLLLLFVLVTAVAKADEYKTPGSCGEYKVSGTAKIINNTPFIVINEQSVSEYVLSIPIEEEPSLAPFINRHFTLNGLIEKKLNGMKGEMRLIKNITLRIPNPLNGSKDTGLKLIKDIPCKN